MYAARINRFGPPSVFEVGEGDELRPPVPGELRIRIRATSINPIDWMRRSGYGKNLLGLLGATRFPLILGHDLAGEVEYAPEDPALRPHGFKEGDRVFGALPPGRNGSYASHCLALPEWLRPIPKGLNFEQAASLPYVGLTGFAALEDLRLKAGNAAGKKVLIQGASGGVGSFCTQILAGWGADITTLSGPDNLEFCRKLGAGQTLDYHQLKEGQLCGFDAVLACYGLENSEHFHPRLLAAGGSYTTLHHPLLTWSDRLGILPGATSAGCLYLTRKMRWKNRNRHYRWSLFSVNNTGMSKLEEALDKKQVEPVIQQCFELKDIAEAHAKAEQRHTRGKLVLTLPNQKKA